MKIFYLSTSEIPSKTANSVHVMKMCQALALEGNDVTLFGISKPYDESIFNYYGVKQNFQLVRHKKIKVKGLGSLLNAKYTSLIIKKTSDIDLLYGRDIYSLFMGRKLGIKIIYEAHALPSTALHKFMEKCIFQSDNFSRLVVISEALKRAYLKEYYYLNEKNILVAPDGADVPEENEQEEAPSESIQNSILNIGYIGHLYSGRGIELIIELARRFNDLEFHIIGGMEKDISFWKSKCKTIKNIKFHGFVPNGQLGTYYSKLDIMLAPYQNKVQVAGDKGDTSKWMSPMKIFEYMSYKKAIIASDLPVLREILHDGENCLLCDPDDIEAWESGLEKLVNDDFLRLKLGNKAFKNLCESYTWNMRVRKVLDN